jgi:hypothetical protein
MVVTLLNRIPVNDGGAGGSLNGRIVSGRSSDALYGAISQFEDKHFPGQRSGFVDPAGLMLKRMEELAARMASTPAPAPKGPVKEDTLDILRRNVLDETPVRGVWTAGERVAFDPLITLAVRHIDSLKEQGFKKFPWDAELFGRAHVIGFPIMQLDKDGTITYLVAGIKGMNEKAPLPEMCFGVPVPGYSRYNQVVTAWLGALLLYDNGACVRIRPWHRFPICMKGLMQPLPIPADAIGRYGKIDPWTS